MQLTSALQSLMAVALMVPSVLATPVDVSSSVEARSYDSSCDPCNMSHTGVLSCKCLNSSKQKVDASLDLNKCIANAGGTAVWRVNGNFMDSCTLFRWNEPFLGLTCKSGGQNHVNALNIDEKVHNINGKLQCHI